MRSLRLTPLALALLACEPPPAVVAPPLPTANPAPPEPTPPAFAAGAWGTFRSERFGLRLPLPEGHAWRIDDHAGPWLSATHAPSGSTLLVRSWTEDGRATRVRCEERARLWRALPDRAGADVVQERSLAAPDGFDTQLVVAIVPGKPGAPIAAFALAFGAHTHRCFAWAYTTSATGPGAERVVGERLAAMVERSLGKAVLDNELVPHIQREPAGPP
jgi:hypothetical protein